MSKTVWPPPGTVPNRSLDRPGCETRSNSIFDRKFWRFLCLRRRFEAILGPKTGLRRVLRTCFSAFFPDAALHRFFVVFSVKNVKLEKMKKCVSICKLHTILEVAPSKKNRCLREKALSIQARISVKNRLKIGPDSDSERQWHQKPTKIASDAISERTFSAPGSIFGDFGPPDGSQKS